MGIFSYDPKDIPPPKFGKSPLELLTDRTVDPPSLSSSYGWQVGCGFLASLCQFMKNWAYRRPRYAGLHMYPIYFGLGFTFGHLFYQYRMNYFAERDAVFRHYIELHPEDFPAPERKKYSDVLLMWVPIR